MGAAAGSLLSSVEPKQSLDEAGEAGSHKQSLRIQTADLVRLTEAQAADICED